MRLQLNIHDGKFRHIAPYWNGAMLYGTCWRLYHNLTPGGRIKTRHETVDLVPDHIYLLPPRLSFTATQKNNPKQFFLHFSVSEPFDRVPLRVFAVKIDPFLRDLMERTIREIQPPPHFLSDTGNLYATALTAATMTIIPKSDIPLNPMDPRVDETIDFFRDQIGTNVKVSEAARRIGMSEGALIRLFKKETGLTPHAYLTDMRITWARGLLEEDSLPIDLIAEYTGFTDRFHFSKTFKKLTGVSPAAYRRETPGDGRA